MADGFITFAREGESRIEISKSEFIGNSCEVKTAQEAEDFVAKIRSTYPDARHVCYAWRVSGETFMQKYSDDGEPSGTGGMPILNVLEKRGVSNAVITVTRYFGGILLGKGGLVRAYTEAASEAANASGLVSVCNGIVCSMEAGYDMSEKLIYALNNAGWSVQEPEYGANVIIRVTCPAAKEGELISFVEDKSFGRVKAAKEGECLIRKPLPQN